MAFLYSHRRRHNNNNINNKNNSYEFNKFANQISVTKCKVVKIETKFGLFKFLHAIMFYECLLKLACLNYID